MRALFFLLLTNVLVMVTVGIFATLTGANRYLDANGLNLAMLAQFCLLWGFAGAFISLAISRFMAKKAYGVQLVNASGEGPLQRQTNLWLYDTVEKLARAANLPMPEVGVYEGSPNAFATGPTKSSSIVAVSTGLLNKLTPEEVTAVLAHEVAHIKNGDMVTMTLITGCVNAFSMFLSRVLAFAIERAIARSEEDSTMIRFGLTIVFDILFSILGQIVVAYVSRAREYRADAGAARLVGANPMISALNRLSATPTAPLREGMAAFGIAGKTQSFLNLFASHPSMKARVDALAKGAYAVR